MGHTVNGPARTGLACLIALASVNASAAEPAAVAFGAREGVEQLSLSPDGNRIAFIAPGAGQSSTLFTVSVLDPAAKPRPALKVSGAPDRLANCHWVSNDRLICTVWGMVKAPAVERPLAFSRLVAVDADGANQRMLENKPVNARYNSFFGGGVIDWLPGQDAEVLMIRYRPSTDQIGSLIGSRREGIAVERVNTQTLKAKTVENAKPDVSEYITDGKGVVRIAGYPQYAGETGQMTGVTRYRYRPSGSIEWRPLSEVNTLTRDGFDPIAVDPARNLAFGFRKADGRRALFTKALDDSGREEKVYGHSDVDVDGLVMIGRSRRVIGVSYATDRRQVVYFDPEIRNLTASLHKALPKSPQVTILDASADENKLLVFAGSDNDPGTYYLFDKTSRKLQPLMQKRPQLADRQLAKVQSVTVPVGNGASIPAYLTLPPGGAAKGLPAIVLPHGGPAARDEWGFDWLPQFYASRGYAVLQPNFRGSEGYGDDFQLENGFRSWKTAVGDVAASGRWLLEQGIADPKTLAIVGWSYGGYAALQSAVMDRDLFKAVVAIAPVTDFALFKDQQRQWSNRRVMSDYVGPAAAEASPAQNAARIKAPVLLVHGTLDSNVLHSASTLMEGKLRAAGGKVELLSFPGLDHQLADSAARVRMLERSDTFLRGAMGL